MRPPSVVFTDTVLADPFRYVFLASSGTLTISVDFFNENNALISQADFTVTTTAQSLRFLYQNNIGAMPATILYFKITKVAGAGTIYWNLGGKIDAGGTWLVAADSITSAPDTGSDTLVAGDQLDSRDLSGHSTIGLGAGTAIIGKVGTDQTTPGTTDLVHTLPVQDTADTEETSTCTTSKAILDGALPRTGQKRFFIHCPPNSAKGLAISWFTAVSATVRKATLLPGQTFDDEGKIGPSVHVYVASLDYLDGASATAANYHAWWES